AAHAEVLLEALRETGPCREDVDRRATGEFLTELALERAHVAVDRGHDVLADTRADAGVSEDIGARGRGVHERRAGPLTQQLEHGTRGVRLRAREHET